MNKSPNATKIVTPTQFKRYESLIPLGVPKNIRCYDNGVETLDRYTVVFTKKRIDGEFEYVGMSEYPFHPQGFGTHGSSDKQIDVNKAGWAPAMGRKNHLGKRIPFSELPQDCKTLVVRDYRQIWDLPVTYREMSINISAKLKA